jgi:TRAP-type mannitol/chloroaromatic compound transport system permease large subunit
MRATSLIRLAAEAEMLRIRHMLTRQGMRAAYGLAALVFALGVLVLANIIGWQVLRLYVDSIYATVILLGINLLLTTVFAMLAVKSSPSYAEQEALKVRQEALQEVQGSIAVSTVLLPLVSRLIRPSRPRGSNGGLFGWRRKQPLLGAARGQKRDR